VEELVPSLMFGSLPQAITWDYIESEKFIEEVVAGSNNGPRTLKLQYSRSGCGYIR
jgi:hypothetical protein